MSSCTIDEIDTPSEWNALLCTLPRANLTHAWSYGEAKRETTRWQVRRFVVHRAGEAVALCQVPVLRVLGVGLVWRIYRGPALAEDPQGERLRDTLKALRRRWRYLLHGLLLIAPAADPTDANRRLMAEAGFRRRSDDAWRSTVLDLSPGEADLRKGLSGAWRNQLRFSEKAGVKVEAGDAGALDWLLEKHERHMLEKGFAGPSAAFVRAMYRADPGACVVTRAVHDGEPVAGMLAVRVGRCSAENYVAWVGEAGRRLKAGNGLYWGSALELKRRGVRWFDLGGLGSGSAAYGAFKSGMGGAEYRFLGEWFAC